MRSCTKSACKIVSVKDAGIAWGGAASWVELPLASFKSLEAYVLEHVNSRAEVAFALSLHRGLL